MLQVLVVCFHVNFDPMRQYVVGLEGFHKETPSVITCFKRGAIAIMIRFSQRYDLIGMITVERLELVASLYVKVSHVKLRSGTAGTETGICPRAPVNAGAGNGAQTEVRGPTAGTGTSVRTPFAVFPTKMPRRNYGHSIIVITTRNARDPPFRYKNGRFVSTKCENCLTERGFEILTKNHEKLRFVCENTVKTPT
jgi:hypothetical protein